MKNLIEISYKSVSNSTLATHLGLTEGLIRTQKKSDDPKLYLDNLSQYIIDTQPFLKVETYAKEHNIDVNKLIKKIKDGQISGFKSKKQKKEKTSGYLVPFNVGEAEELKEDIKTFENATVVAFANRSGGAGKSTNSIAFGTALATLGFDVLFVDGDTQSNSSQRLGLRPDLDFKYSIVDLMTEIGKSTDNCNELVKDSIIELGDSLKTLGKFDVIPNSGKYENEAKLTRIEEELKLYGTAYKSLDMTLNVVKKEYDFIVIDTAPSISTPMTISALATDYFVLSYRPEDKSYSGVPMLMAKLKEEIDPVYKAHKNKSIKIIGGIITDFDSKVNVQKDNIDIIRENFKEINKRYNQNPSWNVFEETIKHLTKFEEIKIDSKGTLFSPESLSESLDKNVSQVIKDYLTITTKIVERIIIDKFEEEAK